MTTHDQIRERVFERERARWARITATPGALGRVLQSIFGKNPAEGLYIVEHEAADPRTLCCTGAIRQAWCLDERGLRTVDPAEVDPGKTIGRMWQYQLVRLFISDDGKHVFLNEMDGPEQGALIEMQPREHNGQITLKMHLVVPAHRGHAVG